MSSPIFLDFQATTPLDERVLNAMVQWFQEPANSHSAQHQFGRSANAAVEQAREQLAKATGTKAEGVLFTPSATFACNQVLRSFAGPEARLVVSAIEHPCVLETAQWCAEQGAALDIIPVGEDGLVDLDRAYALIEDATFVSVMAVNNEVGTIQPIRDLAAYCHVHGAIFHSDAAQALGRTPLTDIGDDVILTLSSHKAYGPQGIGAICTSPSMLAKLQPLIKGGGQQDGLQPGTLPTALCVGFGYAGELALSEREADWMRAENLSDRFLARLRSLGLGFQFNGSSDNRIPHNLNLSFDGVDADALLALLPQVALATGSACSSGAIGKSKVLAAMSLPAPLVEQAVRIGFGRTSREAEIDEAADLIAAAIKRLAEGS